MFRIRIHLIRIRIGIQHFRLNTVPIRIRIQSRSSVQMTKNGKNLQQQKKYNLPIPRPPERTSNLQKKPSALKREHPALQNMKFPKLFVYFCGPFLPSWTRIPNPDTDQRTWLNPDPIRMRIRNTGCPAGSGWSRIGWRVGRAAGRGGSGQSWIWTESVTLMAVGSCLLPIHQIGYHTYIVSIFPAGSGWSRIDRRGGWAAAGRDWRTAAADTASAARPPPSSCEERRRGVSAPPNSPPPERYAKVYCVRYPSVFMVFFLNCLGLSTVFVHSS